MAKEKIATIKEVRAHARYIHVSPQKLRLVSNLIKKAPVDQALEQLRFSSKKAALPIAKAINSAVANAVHNHDFKQENLFVKSITIDSGPMFKRYTPRAQGRAFMIRRRTSHINVTLEERERKIHSKRKIFQKPKALVTEQPNENKLKPQEQTSKLEESAAEIQKPKFQVKPREKIKKQLVDLKRRLFNRKSST
ncbi:MAG: 50S ribosomal protein L22 [Candidatus Doudnabacteria bacterium]|nr:50S ribosomal protein L22 [Candidatus Doudnabacteria bacterium]